MEWTTALSATARTNKPLSFYYKSSCSNPNLLITTSPHSSPTRPSQLAGSLRLSTNKPSLLLTSPFNFQRNSFTPAASAGGDESSGSLADAIVLHVQGMACEGCVASVTKILESQPEVSSASVNLAKEMAIVWLVDEAKAIPESGEKLAKHLTSCGFKSNLQS